MPQDLDGLSPLGAGLSGFSEDELVEQPAIARLEDLGWEHVNLFRETFGLEGSPWRESRRDAILVKRLRMALEKLNPELPTDALDLAVDELSRSRAALVPVSANREVLDTLRDGVKVTFRDPDTGGERTETVRVVDWRDPAANDFVLASRPGLRASCMSAVPTWWASLTACRCCSSS